MQRFIRYSRVLLLPLALCCMVAAAPARAESNNKDELIGIHALLDTYTQSVTDRDEKKFEAQLLDLNIPFMGTGKLNKPGFVATTQNMGDYASFKAEIFQSERRYKQYFKDVKIEQNGNLAQVSLHFVTTDAATGEGGEGWKTLQLLKVQGQWKIASEFFH